MKHSNSRRHIVQTRAMWVFGLVLLAVGAVVALTLLSLSSRISSLETSVDQLANDSVQHMAETERLKLCIGQKVDACPPLAE